MTPSRCTLLACAALLLVAAAVATVLLRRSATAHEGQTDAAARTEPAPPALLAADPRHAAGAAKPQSTSTSDPDTTPSEAGDGPLHLGDGPVRLVLRLVGEGVSPRRIKVAANPHGPGAGSIALLDLDPAHLGGKIPEAATYDLDIALVTPEGECRLSFEAVPRPADGVIEKEIRLPTRATIEVVDALLSTPIPAARAVFTTAYEFSVEPAPVPDVDPSSAGDTLADDAGRIRLPLSSEATYWWVGAPAHAWSRVVVPAGAKRARAALGPGGGVRITIDGFADLDDPRVVITPVPRDAATPAASGEVPRLRGDDESERDVNLRAGAEPGIYAIDGLAPGPWTVLVGREGTYRLEEAVGEATVEVVAGRTTEAVVKVAGVKKASRFDLPIEVVVPEAWAHAVDGMWLSGVGVQTTPCDQHVRLPGSAPGVRRVVVEGAIAGPYQVRVDAIGWQRLVRARAGETLRVEIPQPAVVAVSVLDEQGKPLDEGVSTTVEFDLDDATGETGATARPAAPEDRVTHSSGTAPRRLPFDAGRSLFAGAVVSGTPWLVTSAPGRITSRVRVSLVPGAAERLVEVRLQRGATLEVRILHGGKVDPDAAGDVVIETHAEHGEEADWLQSGSVTEGRRSFDALAGGTFDVVWTRGGGHHPLRKTVTLRPPDTTVVEFEDG